MRLAPEPDTPRSVTPCVVGFDTRDDERRNRLKPGVFRSASSSEPAADVSSSAEVTTVVASGVASRAAPRDAVTTTVSTSGAGWRTTRTLSASPPTVSEAGGKAGGHHPHFGAVRRIRQDERAVVSGHRGGRPGGDCCARLRARPTRRKRRRLTLAAYNGEAARKRQQCEKDCSHSGNLTAKPVYYAEQSFYYAEQSLLSSGPCVPLILAVLVASSRRPCPASPGRSRRFVRARGSCRSLTTVIDEQGRFVPGLEQDEFTILDNGMPQDITFFQNDVQPFTAVVMLDYSASMTANLDRLQAAAEQFVLRMLPEDKGQVGAFSDKIQFSGTFTNDRDDLIFALRDLQFGNPTRLYDAINESIAMLRGVEGRKVVLGLHRWRRHRQPCRHG